MSLLLIISYTEMLLIFSVLSSNTFPRSQRHTYSVWDGRHLTNACGFRDRFVVDLCDDDGAKRVGMGQIWRLGI